MTAYARFQEPREENYWRIHHVYKVESVVIIPSGFESDRIADIDELDFDVWTFAYEVEILKAGNGEPEIIGVSGVRFDGKVYHQHRNINGSLRALAEHYIANKTRWERLREETLERGERQSAREAA